jgi:uncharacterized protein
MSADPVEVFQRGVELLLAKDMAGFVGLYAEDAVMEFPFAPPGRPGRLEGRAEVHEYLAGYPDQLDVREIGHTIVHRTDDPRVVVTEFSAEGVVVATGKPYATRYIAVLTVRDGQITHHRDYWNPLAFQEVSP